MITRLVLAHRACAQLDADVLAHPGVETGGLLPCRVIGDAMVVPFTIAGGPKAVRAPSRFSPDTGWQQQLLDFSFEAFTLDFGGAWHRHPGHFDVPSGVDLRTARHIVTDPEWNVEQAVFPIAIVRDGRVSVRAFFMHRDSREFREIPIERTPNNDPRVLAILCANGAVKKEV